LNSKLRKIKLFVIKGQENRTECEKFVSGRVSRKKQFFPPYFESAKGIGPRTDDVAIWPDYSLRLEHYTRKKQKLVGHLKKHLGIQIPKMAFFVTCGGARTAS